VVLMDRSLAAACDFPAAVRAEAVWRPDLVPSPLINRFAAKNTQLMIEYVSQQAKANVTVIPADVLVAYKWRNGRRPVSLMRFEDRALYTAVANRLQAELPENSYKRERGAYRQFTAAPTQVEGGAFVAATDITNYYSSIPIDLLVDLVQTRSGRVDGAQWVGRFLRALSGRHVGIPQVNRASEILADSYGDELERKIERRGIKVFRYSDDFRMVTSSHKRAVEALDIFDEEARELGLSMNERKTYIQSMERYERKLAGFGHNEEALKEAVREQLTNFDLYSQEPIPPDEAAVARTAALQMLELWEEVDLNADFETDAGAGKLAGRALSVLETLEDGSALDIVENLLRFEPQLTPQIARYMAAAGKQEKDKVLRVAEDLVKRRSLSKWQRMWMLSVFENGEATWEPKLLEWIRTQADVSQVPALRAYALWILSRNWDLEIETWRASALDIGPLHSPYTSAALADCMGVGAREAESLMPANYLDRKVYEWVRAGEPAEGGTDDDPWAS
jgi:hypothetical protein